VTIVHAIAAIATTMATVVGADHARDATTGCTFGLTTTTVGAVSGS
jgi:hypothetical protein